MAGISKETMEAAKAANTIAETVEMPEWGGSCGIRKLTSRERFEYEKGFSKGLEEADDFRAKLVFLCAVDPESGARQFTTPEDYELLCSQPSELVQRVFDVANKVNALKKDEVKRLEKNSETTDTAASSSV